jgi:uncharacterized Zn finger protein (UPF0148 family)
MTNPRMVRCPGSGQKVDGPDENEGTVFCSVCGMSFLPMTTTTDGGKIEFSVSEHMRRANPPRIKGVPKKRRDRMRGDRGRQERRR